MKKRLLLAIAAGIAFSGMAQQKATVSQELFTKSVKAEFTKGTDNAINLNATINPFTSSKLAVSEEQIGTSYYDLQTNSVLGERAYMTDDGEMAAVWTMGNEAPDFADRGTGYNYFDGSSWGPEPDVRIDAARSGWPSIAQWGDGEVVTAHGIFEGDYTSLGLMTRPTRGTGDWTLTGKPTSIDGAEYVWLRIATSGPNNDIIHVINDAYNAVEGQDVPIVYNRSTDGGQTWEIEDHIFPETGPEFYNGFSADDYKIVSNGSTVCIFYVSAWHDLFYMRSDDDGVNWSKKMVWEHPYPLFDWDNTITEDTIWGPDGSFDAEIDNNGHVHMVFPLTRVIHVEAGTGYNYFPYTDAVVYWNDEMDQFVNEDNQHYALHYDNLTDDQYFGWTLDMDENGTLDLVDDLFVYRSLGMCTMPTLTIDDDNQIFVVWSAFHEGLLFAGETPYNYHHLFGRAKTQFGWDEPVWLSQDFLHTWDEIINPVMFGTKDEKVHFFANIDNTPGLALDDEHPYIENRFVSFTVDYSDFLSSVEENETALVSVSQNYPNPTNGMTYINVNMDRRADAVVSVVNMVGQTVMVFNQNFNAGENLVSMNVNDLSSGIYFYTVKIGTTQVTNKMIVE